MSIYHWRESACGLPLICATPYSTRAVSCASISTHMHSFPLGNAVSYSQCCILVKYQMALPSCFHTRSFITVVPTGLGMAHSPLETGNPLPAATPTAVHPAALTCVSLYAPMLTTSIELIRVMNNFVSLMPRHQRAWRMTRYGRVSLKVTVYTN